MGTVSEQQKQQKRNWLTVKVVFVLMTVIFFLTVAGFSWVITEEKKLIRNYTELIVEKEKVHAKLVRENQQRIKDIQASRTSSCRRTYEGIREVFKPFFPPKPRTGKEQEDLDKFNDTINRLKRGCTKQTDPNDPNN